MFLTLVAIPNAVVDAYVIHQEIWKLFAYAKQRTFLYRTYTDGDKHLAIIQSPKRPIMHDHQSSCTILNVKTLDLRNITNNSKLYFKVNTSPTKYKNGKPCEFLFSPDDVLMFANKRLHGAEIIDANVEQETPVIGFKGTNRISLNNFSLTGILTVTDADMFIRTMTNGIGKGKAFGLGLITIAIAE